MGWVDVFGVGIGEFYDEFKFVEFDEWEIEVEGYDVFIDGRNVVVVVVRVFVMFVGEEFYLWMKFRKEIRLRSGFGSLGVLFLVGVLVVVRVLGIEDDGLIIKVVFVGEEVVLGSVYGDNVVLVYYGDFMIIEFFNFLRVYRILVDFLLVVVLF